MVLNARLLLAADIGAQPKDWQLGFVLGIGERTGAANQCYAARRFAAGYATPTLASRAKRVLQCGETAAI